MLYARVKKVLYGMVKNNILFYRKIREDLETSGFTINPYNPGITINKVKGSQMMVTWHAENQKKSQKNRWEIT